ncbi:kinase-like domain-containing protein [Aspergillus avenaceus]|uniref:Kinase-like domain-containing protein n=1 Tax=Aspergillus avenaceus TaxID=36643 RepID=A0A5N6U0Q2_ASPAV|nr:kinase-like domain-containing protein [Aspergillus avenaceus]
MSLAEARIDEIDLYRYQRYRWLADEPHKLAVRYRKFNLQALLDASVKASGNDDNKCVKLLKCVEGQFNKAFVLTMNSGDEIVARLPNPNAGPAFYTVASEVATRHLLRDCLDIPIPRVYAWSSEASNPVGAEYILEEKATGQPLGKLWDTLSISGRLAIVDQIVALERKLASISFPKHGCLYYESDLNSRSANYERLDTLGGTTSISSLCRKGKLTNLAIGPSTNPRLWEGKRVSMDLERGPWNNIIDYATAIGKNEINWATSYVQPRINPHRSLEHPETPDEYISLVTRYIEIVPYMVSNSISTKQNNTISHPDLHLDNIFVDPKTNRITYIIDWQHVCASPLSIQRLYPQMLELSAPKQSDQYPLEKTLLHHYCDAVKETDPQKWSVLSDPFLTVRTDPIHLVPGCWDREDLFSLRNALIKIIARWSDIDHSEKPCPIKFTDEELQTHQSEMELIEGISGIMHQLQDEGLIPLGGMVRQEYYEAAKKFNETFKQRFVEMAENDDQRELHRMVWPYI